jgi:hypothetical protein
VERITDSELPEQARIAAVIRAAATRVEAPPRLRAALAELHDDAAIPIARRARTTCMRPLSPAPPVPAAPAWRGPAAAWWLTTRALGALATLAVGAVHLQQYLKLYSAVPTIGTLFVLNFAGATVLGLALLAPIERVAGRHGRAAVAAVALAAIGLSATAFAFLLVSEHTPLFGFQEPGYDPPAIAAARISEIAAVVLLGAFLAAHATHARRSS